MDHTGVEEGVAVVKCYLLSLGWNFG